MKLLKKTPFFVLLLPLFFCLHGWLQNYGFIRFEELLLLCLQIFSGVILFTAFIYLLNRKLAAASLTAFFISGWYLFFGALHDGVKSLPGLAIMKTYTAMLLAFGITSLVWVIYINKKNTNFQKPVFFLNLLMIIYCSIDVGLLIKKN
jgi:hypothetical protein